jgi:hypothetical protein
MKVIPEGSVPDSESEGVGMPVVVTVKDPALPTLMVVLSALVRAGGWLELAASWALLQPDESKYQS